MVKKVIVTGCAGFVGSNLTNRLLNAGIEVWGVDNFSYGEKRNIEPFINHPKFHFTEGELTDFATLDKQEGEVLVHLASQKIPRYSNAYRTLNENSAMLKNVIDKCLRDKIRVVFASTSDIYGKNPEIPYSETSNSVLGPTTVKRWSYALSKIYSEHQLISHNQEFNLDYTIIRIFGSYGPNQNLTWWGGPQALFIEKAFKNKEIEIHGDGLQTRTFTFIEDTVDGFFKAVTMREAVNDIFNVASEPDEEITIIGLANFIWKMVNGTDKAKVKFIPYATFGNYEDVRRRVPDITKIKAKLGFSPSYNLESGMRKTIEWQKNLMNY